MSSPSDAAAANSTTAMTTLTPEELDAIWDLLPRVHIDNTFGAVLLGTFIGLTSVSSSP